NFKFNDKYDHVIRLKALDTGINLDWLQILPASQKSAFDESLVELSAPYPNPFTNQLFIQLNSDDVELLTISDVTGRLINNYELVKSGNGIQIQFMNELSPGIYVLTVVVDGETKSFNVVK
ncbi:MAG: T9SS type A sorting domain-containing protein, partial [Bacteroidales bacterium]|nr:T9SS type A sorting domain-containing protein [Bacteroidales bacterium]